MYRTISDYEHASFDTEFPTARLAMAHARAAEAEGASVLVLDPEGLLVHATEEQ